MIYRLKTNKPVQKHEYIVLGCGCGFKYGYILKIESDGYSTIYGTTHLPIEWELKSIDEPLARGLFEH